MQQRSVKAVIIIVTIAIAALFTVKQNRDTTCMYGDALGYYLYLPSAFIYHNLDHMDNVPRDSSIPGNVYAYVNDMRQMADVLKKDYVLDQYTYGVALWESPFFFAAHAIAKITGGPAMGFSDIYIWAIVFSSWLFTFLGMLLTYRVLRRIFDDVPALLSVALIFLATHMFWFSLKQSGMSHIPLYFLYAWLMYLTVRMHEEPKRLYFILAGFVAGSIFIMRPTDIICLLIPFLYGVYNKQTFKNKMTFLYEHKGKIGLAMLVFVLPTIPQLFYWKLVTGDYIVYSYGQQEFHWMHPQIMKGLFSYGNGWLPYAPIMVFAIVGFVWLRKYKIWVLPLATVVPLYVYIIYSWFCFNYINGMGSRPMIHMYPLLAIPLAAFIQYIYKRHFVVKATFATIVVVFITAIYCFSVAMAKFVFVSEYATKPYYFNMLFKTKIDYNDLLVYDMQELQPDVDKMTYLGMLAIQDFNTPNDSVSHFVPDPEEDSGYVYHLDKGYEYASMKLIVPYDKEAL
ncbi:MAG: glycosyltransferase family 39 protein, partial [Chitinophagaceae bacterium]|nr:glycosyltransferase family 39 protein [Chitinophagaceae bacterium]